MTNNDMDTDTNAGRPDVVTSLTAQEREERKRAKREAKSIKKAQREMQKMENRMRLDKRVAVRMAAKIEHTHAKGGSTEDVTDNNIIPTHTNQPNPADRVVSMIDMSLDQLSLDMLSYPPTSILEHDLSHNSLSDIPGLSQLKNLVSLDIHRNEFRKLPEALRELTRIAHINASRNHLRASADLLVLLTMPPLPSLETLDLTFNKKLFTQSLLNMLTTSLPSVAVHMTVTSPPPKDAYVGDSPGERDPTLLRSQLEPFTTLELRKRLVETFGHEPYSNFGAPPPGRAVVMSMLLAEYAKLGPERKIVRSLGKPVPNEVLQKVHNELEAWSDRYDKFQERPMIKASKYMILRSPTEAEAKMIQLGSRRAHSAIRKYQQNLSLWAAAKQAVASVDEQFANEFTGLAVTKGFIGSPHIDTTNIGPFYGLSIGDFEDGTGGVRVELDSLTVCEVNTKNRLGKVDGRFPHWVAPYDETKTRYSLIFYLTEGEIQPKSKAVFGAIQI